MKNKILMFLSIIIIIVSLLFWLKVTSKNDLELSNNFVIEEEELGEENIIQEEKTEIIHKRVSIFDVPEEKKAGVRSLKVELNQENCEYFEAESKITLEEYEGTADVLVIPNQINGIEINEINPNAFENCYDLEIIKIDKDIANENIEIKDFVKYENSQDDEYIEYVTTREYSEAYQSFLNLAAEEKQKQEVVPQRFYVPAEEIYSEEFQNLYNVASAEDTQSSFDLRDKIEIEVENQNQYGICYAYANFSAIETNLALTQNKLVDLSEIHMAVVTGQGSGGNFVDSKYDYFASKIGPVLEEEWPMEEIHENASNDIDRIIDEYLRSSENTVTEEQLEKVQEEMKKTKAAVYVTESVRIPSINKSMKQNMEKQDEINEIRSTIKKHIVNYGGLYCSLSMDDWHTYNGYTVLNYSGEWKSGHGVTIIGWDDNFSRYNFPLEIRPKKDGAYLALNSYGENWANSGGYFWISYEDGFAEHDLRGVTTVEEITENMHLDVMEITDINTDEIVRKDKIKIGEKVQVSLDLRVEEIKDNQDEFIIKLRKRQQDLTNKIEVSGTKIENNTSKTLIDIDTRKLEKGAYILEVMYGDETILKEINIISNTFEYKVNEDGTSITILGYNGKNVDLEIPKEYVGYNVTKIGDYAFNKRTDIQTITVYENIQSIGKSAFDKLNIIYGYEGTPIEEYANKNSYTFIKIETEEIGGDYWKFNTQNNTLYITGEMEDYKSMSDVPWYKYRNNIHKINIKDGIKEIKNNAFHSCSNLKEVNIPLSIVKIGDKGFYSCSSIEKLEIHNNVLEIGKEVFANCGSLKDIKLPAHITEIGESMFLNDFALTKIEIPEGVISIGKSAFASCRNLEEVKLPIKLQSIGERAFNACAKLTQIKLPSELLSIENRAFYDCNVLEEIIIPPKVTRLGESVFGSCECLTKIEIPKEIEDIGEKILAFSILNINVKFEGGDIEKTIDMPEILLRATKEADVLYSLKSFLLSGCEIDVEKR